MNKKLFFFISREDTVIWFVIAICPDPHEELLFSLFQRFPNALLSFLPYLLLESFAFYYVLSFLFYDVCKRACLCDTWRKSHIYSDVRSPVEVLPEGLSFIQLRKSHWTTALMHLNCTHNTTCCSSSVCVCFLLFGFFCVSAREKARSA